MEQENRLYWTSVEFNFLSTHKEFKKAKGGMVYAFVQATDSKVALERIIEELHLLKLEPFDFEYIKPYESGIWDEEKDELHFQSMVDEALNCQNVILDDFYIYEQVK